MTTTTATRDELATRIDAKINGLGTRLATCLAAANGRRRERTVTLTEALEKIARIADGKTWVYRHGGRVANNYNKPAISTFVLAARVDGKVRLGVTVVNARGNLTPGRGWASLQPWYDAGPRGDAAAKWSAWTRDAGVLTLEDPEVDAILEALGETD